MQKLHSRLEAIRSTIELDASTLGEEAAPKDFGFQEAIAKNDPTLLDVMTKELEQFTNSPDSRGQGNKTCRLYCEDG